MSTTRFRFIVKGAERDLYVIPLNEDGTEANAAMLVPCARTRPVVINSDLSIVGEIKSSRPLTITPGSYDTPGVRFSSNNGTGVYEPEANALGFSVNGIGRIKVSGVGVEWTGYGLIDEPEFIGRHCRGSVSAIFSTQVGDSLGYFSGTGYGATGWSAVRRGSFAVMAGETWSDSAQGTYLSFLTTKNAGVVTDEKMRVTGGGTVQIGNCSTPTELNNPSLVISRNVTPLTTTAPGTNTQEMIIGNTNQYPTLELVASGSGYGGVIYGRACKGTLASPTASGSGDPFLALRGTGRGATGWANGDRVKIQLEGDVGTWSDTLQPTRITFHTTPNTASASSTEIARMHADGGMRLGAASSTSPGAGVFAATSFKVGGTPGSEVTISMGSGTPEGAITARVGSLFLRTDGGAGTTLYVKESGAGNTGWVGK